MYTRGSCKTPTFWAGVPPPAADGDGTPSLPDFAAASHINGVTITASRRGEYMYIQPRNNEMARMAGLEPATAALTVRGSTIELHPNNGGGSRIRTDVMQLMRLPLVTTPVDSALCQETFAQTCRFLQLPPKSRHPHKRIPRKSVTPFAQFSFPTSLWRGHDGG